MATYIPNATNTAEPQTSRFVASAAAEFRALKSYVEGLASASTYVGEWSALTGALASGRTVSHNGLVWFLLVPLADVTASEPTSLNPDWLDFGNVKRSGDTMLGDLTVPSLNGGQLAGHRNKVINGSGEIDQRGLTSVADDAYFADMFYVLTESGNVTVAQITDPEPGAPFGFRLTQPDVVAKRMGFAQIIESKNIRQYANTAMNLFCRVKYSASTAIRYAVIEHIGVADTVVSDVVNDWASTNFIAGDFFIAGVNIVDTGTLTPGAAVFGEIDDWSALGASVKNVILFIWTESAVAQNGTLEWNRLQYEPGVLSTPFEWRLNEAYLAEYYCQAYIGASIGSGCVAGGGFAATISFPYRRPMRIAPALSVPVMADFCITNGIGNYSFTGIITGNGTTISTELQATGMTAGASSGQGCTLRCYNVSLLQFNRSKLFLHADL